LIYNIKHFFIFKDGQYLPYFIDEVLDKGDIVLKLDIITSPQQASMISGKNIYVSADQVSEDKIVSVAKFGDVKGYTVFNDDIELGIVEEIIEFPSQLMIKIQHNSKEKLLPMIDAFLINIDQKGKKIVLHLPDGILDL
jgi:16S rRNA processing protein RimM